MCPKYHTQDKYLRKGRFLKNGTNSTPFTRDEEKNITAYLFIFLSNHNTCVITGKKDIRQTPKLQSLPPTSESFSENVKRAHLQMWLWKTAMDSDPPDTDSTNLGWIEDTNSKILAPVTIPADELPALLVLLQMICCGCASDQLCATARCSSHASQ